jgi:hypothetical protein
MSPTDDTPLVSPCSSPQTGCDDFHKGRPGIEAPVSFRARIVDLKKWRSNIGGWLSWDSGAGQGLPDAAVVKKSRGLDIQTLCHLCTKN